MTLQVLKLQENSMMGDPIGLKKANTGRMHTPTVPRQLAQVLFALFIANAPRVGHAAPAVPSPSETHAAEAIEAFEQGKRLEEQGDNETAAQRYRAAAEANAAALKALDRSAAEHLAHAHVLIKRVLHSYEAALHALEDAELKQAASDWCADLLSALDLADAPNYPEVHDKCAQWKPAASPSLEPSKPIIKRATIEHTGAKGPDTDPQPPRKPWRGLALGGGVALGGGAAFLAVSLVGAVRQVSLQQQFQDAGCTRPSEDERCGDIDRQGYMFERVSVASVITGAVLVGTGAALLAVAMRRRAPKLALAPALHPQFLGLALRGRF